MRTYSFLRARKCSYFTILAWMHACKEKSTPKSKFVGIRVVYWLASLKERLRLSRVKFQKGRLRRYIGNIGEIAVQEVLLKQGFDVWLVTPYYPERGAPRESRMGDALFHYLIYLFEENRGYMYEDDRYPGRHTNVKPAPENYESKIRALKTFFGDKLEAFKQYIERLGCLGKPGIPGGALVETEESEREYIYTPDLVAKKNGEIYIVEVKANTGRVFLTEEQRKGLALAKEYGFIPALITLNVNIEATDLAMSEI